MGGLPQLAEEPTGEQLKCIQLLLDGDQAPYADLSIFGPDGRNIQKRLRYTAFKCIAPGRYEQELLPGPGTY